MNIQTVMTLIISDLVKVNSSKMSDFLFSTDCTRLVYIRYIFDLHKTILTIKLDKRRMN